MHSTRESLLDKLNIHTPCLCDLKKKQYVLNNNNPYIMYLYILPSMTHTRVHFRSHHYFFMYLRFKSETILGHRLNVVDIHTYIYI